MTGRPLFAWLVWWALLAILYLLLAAKLTGEELVMSAVAATIASAPSQAQAQITSEVEAQLQKSFAGAVELAEQYPQYERQIVGAAQQSFVDGQDWAYLAGVVAIVVGAAVVFFFFPKHDDEQALLARYAAEDAREAETGA